MIGLELALFQRSFSLCAEQIKHLTLPLKILQCPNKMRLTNFDLGFHTSTAMATTLVYSPIMAIDAQVNNRTCQQFSFLGLPLLRNVSS